MNYTSHLLQLLSKHKLAFVLSVILATSLITFASLEGTLNKTITYLVTMGACFLVSEFIYFSGKKDFESWKIKNPKKELMVTLVAILAASVLLTYWFVIIDQEKVGQTTRVVTMILRFVFIFPIFLLVYYLGVEKYKLRTIGLWSFKYWFVSIPLIILIGGVTYLAFPGGMIEHVTIQSMIGLGFLTAAIPEEIARTLFQSRLGKVINHKGIAWFGVSVIWALQHIPLFAFNSGSYSGAAMGALGILPIGLLWGYLNERYKSIIPSVLIHGTNVWGLHNIF